MQHIAKSLCIAARSSGAHTVAPCSQSFFRWKSAPNGKMRALTHLLLLSIALLSCLLMVVESQKRAAVDNSNSLHLPGILELVLRFVGSGQGLFMSTVSRELAECYEKLFVPAKGPDGEKHAKGRTAYKAALSSPSRVALAHSWGLNLVDHHDACLLKLRAGQHADIATLEAARGLGLPFTGEICDGAAASKSVHAVQKLEWLHLVQRCPLPTAGTPPAAATITFADLIAPRDITATAAANGNIVVLRWLKEQGDISTEPLRSLTTCLFCSTCTKRAAPGTMRSVQQLQHQAILSSCSGCMRMGALSALIQRCALPAAVLRCTSSSGCSSRGLISVSARCMQLLMTTTCSCASGCVKPHSATGLSTPALTQRAGTSLHCCAGCSTAAVPLARSGMLASMQW
jgi:hypothetical protein